MTMAAMRLPQKDARAAAHRLPFLISTFALLYMVIIGLNPLSEKVKTIPATGDGDFARQLSYSAIFLIVLVASRPLTQPRKLLALPLTVTLALGWCWLSVSWAIVPEVSMRRLILTTIIMFSIFRCVREIGQARTITLMRWVLMLTLVLNYLAILVTPAAIHQVAEIGDPNLVGNWRGVLPQKNFAGAICAFTVIVFVFDAQRIRMAVRLAVILAATFFLYKTQSKTSEGILALSLIVGWMFSAYNPGYRALLIPAVSVIGCAAVLYVESNWDALIAPLNSPAAFTGRTQIWPPLVRFAMDHWATGAGFGSFWNIGPYSPIYKYGHGWVSGIASGHNGYIDMLTQVGFPGVILMVISMIVWPMVRLLASHTVARGTGSLLIAMIVFCAGHNLTESSLFDRDMVVQQFLSFAVAMIGAYSGMQAAAQSVPADRASRTRALVNPPPVASGGAR